MAKQKIVYFFRSKDIKISGPYASDVAAWKATMTTEGFPIEGAVVWPEVAGERKAIAR